MNDISNFYTLKGYQDNSTNPLTPSMEDYLEMIYRLLLNHSVVRIGELAKSLNVNPSSTTKIVQALKDKGFINYQQYGYISLTTEGKDLSKYLYDRHNILHDFFCIVNHSENELELVEMVEHFVNRETVGNLIKLSAYLKEHNY